MRVNDSGPPRTPPPSHRFVAMPRSIEVSSSSLSVRLSSRGAAPAAPVPAAALVLYQ